MIQPLYDLVPEGSPAMNIVTSVLDAMIEAAEAADSKLHASLEYLRELRDKLTTFSADGSNEDELVGELRSIGEGS
jgi:hypothetical protein